MVYKSPIVTAPDSPEVTGVSPFIGAAIAVGGTRNGGQEATVSTIINFFTTQGVTLCSGGSGIYAGASLWNPGDGSTEMDDEVGMQNVKVLGEKMAVMTKIMASASIE